jgi:tetratricopeptide (TPR) repeat protein
MNAQAPASPAHSTLLPEQQFYDNASAGQQQSCKFDSPLTLRISSGFKFSQGDSVVSLPQGPAICFADIVCDPASLCRFVYLCFTSTGSNDAWSIGVVPEARVDDKDYLWKRFDAVGRYNSGNGCVMKKLSLPNERVITMCIDSTRSIWFVFLDGQEVCRQLIPPQQFPCRLAISGHSGCRFKLLHDQPLPVQVLPSRPSDDDFPTFGLPPSFLRDIIDKNGGDAAFEGKTTSHVKRTIIVPLTAASKLSLCAQMHQEGDARVQTATWFVSHPWQIMFLDLVRALESFFADKAGAIIWLDLISTSQHATFDKPPEWWQQTFCSAIGRMGQMVMVMTPWDNPICLTRAWCLIELHACRSSGSRLGVALPPSERSRFIAEIVAKSKAYYDMLGRVNTAKSECSRETDKQRIFAAVEALDGGFAGLDRGVLHSMTEWLERQLQDEVADAVAAGRVEDECKMMCALGGLFMMKGEFDRAFTLFEDCLLKRQRILGDDHPDTLASHMKLADTVAVMGEYDRALLMSQQCHENCKRILGEEHTVTLESIDVVALIFLHRGENDRALVLLEGSLVKRERILGVDHPDTLASLSRVANVLVQTEQFDRALLLCEKCLVKRKRILGDDHPDTLASLCNLAFVLQEMRQFERAFKLYEECARKMERVLGENHPQMLSVLNNTAQLLGLMDREDDALLVHEHCLAKRKIILGIDHPDYLASLHNLAASLYTSRNYDRALPMFEECFAKSSRTLGQDHPQTLAAQYFIANCFFEKKDYSRALPLYEICLTKQMHIYGDNHSVPKDVQRRRNRCITEWTQQKAEQVVKKWSGVPVAAKRLLALLIDFDAEMADPNAPTLKQA